MKEMCTKRIAAQPAVMCSVPKPPARIVIKIAQHTISLANCNPAGQPSWMISFIAPKSGRHAWRIPSSASSLRERKTHSGMMVSTAVPNSVPMAAPITPYAGISTPKVIQYGTGKSKFGAPCEPKINA